MFTCFSGASAVEAIQKENESKEDKAGLVLRELADKGFTTCISICIIVGKLHVVLTDRKLRSFN